MHVRAPGVTWGPGAESSMEIDHVQAFRSIQPKRIVIEWFVRSGFVPLCSGKRCQLRREPSGRPRRLAPGSTHPHRCLCDESPLEAEVDERPHLRGRARSISVGRREWRLSGSRSLRETGLTSRSTSSISSPNQERSKFEPTGERDSPPPACNRRAPAHGHAAGGHPSHIDGAAPLPWSRTSTSLLMHDSDAWDALRSAPEHRRPTILPCWGRIRSPR